MEEKRFIADVMLGKLAKWLRMLGYDTLYFRETKDDLLIDCAVKENRQLLTRKTELRNRAAIKDSLFFITHDEPLKQLEEVIAHYRLNILPPAAFTRCLICNQRLEEISPDQIQSRLPDYVLTTQKHFSTCARCKRIFWRGSHYVNMKKALSTIPQPGERSP
jgi:uncharacterized protein with PIN domain